jgi:hypothetical protein
MRRAKTSQHELWGYLVKIQHRLYDHLHADQKLYPLTVVVVLESLCPTIAIPHLKTADPSVVIPSPTQPSHLACRPCPSPLVHSTCQLTHKPPSFISLCTLDRKSSHCLLPPCYNVLLTGYTRMSCIEDLTILRGSQSTCNPTYPEQASRC